MSVTRFGRCVSAGWGWGGPLGLGVGKLRVDFEWPKAASSLTTLKSSAVLYRKGPLGGAPLRVPGGWVPPPPGYPRDFS